MKQKGVFFDFDWRYQIRSVSLTVGYKILIINLFSVMSFLDSIINGRVLFRWQLT
jgi:hypothetical protein